MFKASTYKFNFTNIVEMESRFPTIRKDIGWIGHGKSRLSKVTHYYDMSSNNIIWDYGDYTSKEPDVVRPNPCLKLKLPIPRKYHKWSQPTLVVNRKPRKVCDLF
jgi:hypothetical protein